MTHAVGLFCSGNIQQRDRVDGIRWQHTRQRFILVQGMVHANPYYSGAATLVFVCSIIGVDAPSYEVHGIGGRLDPKPKVPTLLYIGRRGRVIERVIGLIDHVPSLLHTPHNRSILAIVQIRPP